MRRKLIIDLSKTEVKSQATEPTKEPSDCPILIK